MSKMTPVFTGREFTARKRR